MGGSGVLRFCGKRNLQLIVSKRHPGVANAQKEKFPDVNQWGFTVVRREETDGRNSAFTYLAPLGADKQPRKGGVLRFDAADLPLLPNKQNAYGTKALHGSLVKLYEYDAKGFSGNAMLRDGLKERLEAKLPEPALPIRIHECRDYKGHAGSFETFIYGVVNRLEENSDNLEDGFPDSVQFAVEGERLDARIYAFKPKKRESYFGNEGILLTVNGQTHGVIPQTFYQRKNVRMDRLARSLVVIVDCTTLSQRSREDLFMSSRDRLSGNALTKKLQEQLEEVISHHPGLRALAEKRRREEIDSQLKDDQPLEEILQKMLRSSPELERLLPAGLRLNTANRTGGNGKTNGEGGRGDRPFKGKRHPTFFRFEKRTYGQLLLKNFEEGRKCRIKFETDAENEYFSRRKLRGMFDVSPAEDETQPPATWSITLHDGVGVVSLDFGDEVHPGDTLALNFTVSDDTLTQPFVNAARLTVTEYQEHTGGGGEKGAGSRARGKQDSGPGALSLPQIFKVTEDNWESRSFDSSSAADLLVQGDQLEVHVNVHNAALRSAQRNTKEDAGVLEARFVFGNVLLTLALYQRFLMLEKEAERTPEDEGSKLVAAGRSRFIREVTSSIAPFLLSMIDKLAALGENDVLTVASISDEE